MQRFFSNTEEERELKEVNKSFSEKGRWNYLTALQIQDKVIRDVLKKWAIMIEIDGNTAASLLRSSDQYPYAENKILREIKILFDKVIKEHDPKSHEESFSLIKLKLEELERPNWTLFLAYSNNLPRKMIESVVPLTLANTILQKIARHAEIQSSQHYFLMQYIRNSISLENGNILAAKSAYTQAVEGNTIAKVNYPDGVSVMQHRDHTLNAIKRHESALLQLTELNTFVAQYSSVIDDCNKSNITSLNKCR